MSPTIARECLVLKNTPHGLCLPCSVCWLIRTADDKLYECFLGEEFLFFLKHSVSGTEFWSGDLKIVLTFLWDPNFYIFPRAKSLTLDLMYAPPT